jgi:hypothetical protein
MGNPNNTIGVQEKKELSKIINSEFERIIEGWKQEIENTEGDLLDKAHHKFGIKIINQEIKNLKQKISLLEDRKRELGFGFDDKFQKSFDYKTNERTIEADSKAGQFYLAQINKTADIKSLEKQRDQRLKDIWLNSDREAVKTLVNEKITTPMIATKPTKRLK